MGPARSHQAIRSAGDSGDEDMESTGLWRQGRQGDTESKSACVATATAPDQQATMVTDQQATLVTSEETPSKKPKTAITEEESSQTEAATKNSVLQPSDKVQPSANSEAATAQKTAGEEDDDIGESQASSVYAATIRCASVASSCFEYGD